MPHDVFISYASEDKQVADAVCAALEGAGVACWIAPRDIVAGSYGAAIVKAIASCKVLVLVFSSNANRSSQVRREVERAGSRGKVIYPLRIEDVQPSEDLEFFISSEHWMDAFAQTPETYLPRFASNVKSLLPAVEPSPLVAEPSTPAQPAPAAEPPATQPPMAEPTRQPEPMRPEAVRPEPVRQPVSPPPAVVRDEPSPEARARRRRTFIIIAAAAAALVFLPLMYFLFAGGSAENHNTARSNTVAVHNSGAPTPTPPGPDVNSNTTVPAPNEETARFISDLFATDAPTRTRAARELVTKRYGTPDMVRSLILYAQQHPTEDGVYNTVVVLNNVDRYSLFAHREMVEGFLNEAQNNGRKTALVVRQVRLRLEK